MPELTVTNGFIKKLSKNIRQKYGKEPSHTEVIELIADALGWKAGPLMHALKTGSGSKGEQSREFLTYAPVKVDPIPQAIREATSLHKLRSLGSDDIAAIMNFAQASTGVLLIVANRREDGIQYAASISKDWQLRLGEMEFKPYDTGNKLIPLADVLGVPSRSLSHVAMPADKTVESQGRFVVLESVGHPNNMMEGLAIGRSLPTVLVVDRKLIQLVVESETARAAYWLEGGITSEWQLLLEELRTNTKLVLDVDVVGGRFHRVGLLKWADWEKSQLQANVPGTSVESL